MSSSFVYVSVSHGTNTLCEASTSDNQNYRTIAVRLLEQTISDQSKTNFLLEADKYNFHCIRENSMNYVCFAIKTLPASTCVNFLETLKTQWLTKFGNQGTKFTFMQKQTEFSPQLQQLLSLYNTERVQTIEKTKATLKETQEIMADNLTQALIRGESLETMENKANKLNDDAHQFHHAATSLKHKMCFERYRWYIIGAAIIIVVIFIIVWACCGIDFSKC